MQEFAAHEEDRVHVVKSNDQEPSAIKRENRYCQATSPFPTITIGIDYPTFSLSSIRASMKLRYLQAKRD